MTHSFYRDTDGVYWIDGQTAPADLRMSVNDVATPTAVTFYSNSDFNADIYMNSIKIVDIEDKKGSPYADWADFSRVAVAGFFIDAIGKGASKDRVSSLVILPMAATITSTTIVIEAVLNAYVIEVADSAGFVVGQHIRIIDSDSDRFYHGTIKVIASNTITLDTQIDFEYSLGSEVIVSSIEMNVNGSIAPVIFKHRLGTPSTPSITNITRLIITCISSDPVTLSKFGDLAELAKGVVLRKVGNEQVNYFNIKNNRDIKALAYDFDVSSETNPAQGENGFVSRLTFTKMGAAIEIRQGDNIEVLIQDDLSTLTSFRMMLEGYIV